MSIEPRVEGEAGQALQQQAQALLPDAIALRRRIHEHPELGLDNPRTR